MIEIKDVTKRFDKIKAVDHVSFSIREENVFGLIGTNGEKHDAAYAGGRSEAGRRYGAC